MMNPPLLFLGFNIDVKLDGSWAAWVLLCLLAVVLSAWMYRKTVPPAPRTLRIFLAILRALALIMLVSLIFHPILQIRWPYEERPELAVLIDRSQSMQIEDDGIRRGEKLLALLRHPVWETLEQKYVLHFYPFDAELDSAWNGSPPDTFRFDGEGTNISGALREAARMLSNRFFAGVVLLSDGIYNVGEHPTFYASKYPVPVFTVGIGDPRAKKDVAIVRLAKNDVVYARSKIPVDVYIRQTGYRGKKIRVFLKSGQNILDQKLIELGQDGQTQRIRLHFIPEKPGFQKYRVEIPALTGEYTSKNNYRNFIVKVLESKIRILLLAGEPGFDFTFLRRALKKDENVELTAAVQRKGGGFYLLQNPGEILRKDFQLIVFLGFPRWTLSSLFRNYLKEQLLKKKKPLFFIQGPHLLFSELRAFRDVLPFRLDRVPGDRREVNIHLTLQGESSPITLLTDRREENRRLWDDLPPVVTYLRNVSVYPDAEVLLEVDPVLSKLPDVPQYRKPVLVARQLGEQKSIAFLGHELWRWDFMMWGVGKTNETFVRFLNRAVRWLISREEEKRVRISTDRLVYTSGDAVYFQAQVYDEGYSPVEDAEVRVVVRHRGQERELFLEPIGQGRYEGEMEVFRGGVYSFTGDARRGDQFFGADSGRFSVGEYEVEFRQTRMDEELLRKVALVSGGRYVPPDSLENLSTAIQAQARQRVRLAEVNFWNRWLLLGLIILLLSVEWSIRRRKGML
jgi:hypothetical protein